MSARRFAQMRGLRLSGFVPLRWASAPSGCGVRAPHGCAKRRLLALGVGLGDPLPSVATPPTRPGSAEPATIPTLPSSLKTPLMPGA